MLVVSVRFARRLLTGVGMLAMVGLIGLAGLTHLATTFVVGGGSMEPNIPLGSLIVVEPVTAGSIQVGDAVTVRTDRGIVITHRVVRVASIDGDPYLEIKGDANATPDPALVPMRSVVGRVALQLPWVGYLTSMLGTPSGLISVAAMLACVFLLIRFMEEVEGDLIAGGGRRGMVVERSPGDAVA